MLATPAVCQIASMLTEAEMRPIQLNSFDT